ncbi:hypothetical protein ACH5RR_018442 [Cinchona calisaya]|uniref:Uncharacterized protein n=1 Tax=Cinchona calisaya TaxID=153742 RepID=A0ABD2ZRL2_9GENT
MYCYSGDGFADTAMRWQIILIPFLGLILLDHGCIAKLLLPKGSSLASWLAICLKLLASASCANWSGCLWKGSSLTMWLAICLKLLASASHAIWSGCWWRFVHLDFYTICWRSFLLL